MVIENTGLWHKVSEPSQREHLFTGKGRGEESQVVALKPYSVLEHEKDEVGIHTGVGSSTKLLKDIRAWAGETGICEGSGWTINLKWRAGHQGMWDICPQWEKAREEGVVSNKKLVTYTQFVKQVYLVRIMRGCVSVCVCACVCVVVFNY